MQKMTLSQKGNFYELRDLAGDQELAGAVKKCVQAQKAAASSHLKNQFIPESNALRYVSPEALEEILKTGKDINGIRTEREISNVIVFNDKRYQEGVFGEEVAAARKQVDQIISKQIGEVFEGERLDIHSSGFFLYPPQGYMSWHTNWQNPGWRLYVSYVETPGKSFFRYKDPDSGKIITSADQGLNVRLFKVSPERLLWHCIYSETYRYSLGYKIMKAPGIFQMLKRKLSKNFLGRK